MLGYLSVSEVPEKEAPKIIFGKTGSPPRLEGRGAVTGYLLMMVKQSIDAREMVPAYDEAKLSADKAVFRAHHAAKDQFWLRYGVAVGAVDVAMATKQIDDGVYEKLRGKLNEVLLSAVTIRL